MFMNSGISADHYGDDENQIIFYGPDVKELVYLTRDKDDNWSVVTAPGPKDNPLYFESKEVYVNEDFSKVVEWVINNYKQYSNKITWRIK